HRLEEVAMLDGVRFVNDSQGTQPDAVIAALRAFDGPIVLIAGGRDKGIDLSDLGSVVAERAVAAVLIGESGPDLERRFRADGLVRTERVGRLGAAVRIAVALTAIGILMVYSSSAMKAYIATDDTLTVVGPQIAWAGLGLIAMVAMMRVDYRYLRFASVIGLVVAVATLVLLLVLTTTGP